MIKMENIITVIKKNAFCELIKRYDMAKERTSELEDRSVKLQRKESSETIKIHRSQRIQEPWGDIYTCVIEISKKKGKITGEKKNLNEK